MKSRLVSMIWKFILGFQIPIFVIMKFNNNNYSKIIIDNKCPKCLRIDINAGNPYDSGGRADGAGA